MGLWKAVCILQYMKTHKIHLRPNSSLGLWLIFLLPLTIIISVGVNPVVSTATYKLASIFSFGLICTSVLLLKCLSSNKKTFKDDVFMFLTFVSATILFIICLHRGLVFSLWSALVCTLMYKKLLLFILSKMSNCFTLGEAALCTQSYILLFYYTVLNIATYLLKTTHSVGQMSTITIQIGFMGLSLIALLTYIFQITTAFKFYLLTASVFIGCVLIPLHLFLQTNALFWIFSLIWNDINLHRVTLYWFFCCVLAVFIINKQIKGAKKASTAVRKTFHLLITAVYILGLLYNCSLIYLASGVIFGIFFMLEILRVLNLPPLGHHLQSGLVIFADEKDQGIIAFTPMYLMAGCCLPLWIHPAPCDVTNSATFNLLPLLSGVLTIGIGDTCASVFGSRFGTWHWRDSKKTIQGTLACIISQLLVVYIFVYLDFIKLFSHVQQLKVIVAIIFTSIIEAKTDQVDNLVLPFIMYICTIV